ncbi:MAG: dihydrolipoyl dehydrogenase [Syntrophaceae bacterium]|nr:dihydrolipoyl dehydrogenase [Syntrophaceae bacterium]
MSEKYDLIVIGGGPGGTAAARKAAQKKKKVLIIEKDGWGGACAHRGCIPTKALLFCSRFYADMKKLQRVGIQATGVTFDFTAMQKHQRQMVRVASLGAHKSLVDEQVETRQATAEILSAHRVRLVDPNGQSRIETTHHTLIAWGSQPQIPPDIRTSGRILTSDDVPGLTVLPSSLIIVGASFIGVEYATVFAELGVRVFLVELLDRILPQEDEEAADFLRQELTRQGITVLTSVKWTSLREMPDQVVLNIKNNNENMEIEASMALLCTGRKPVLDVCKLNELGIHHTNAGISVDERMATSVPGIYAAGDVTGGMMLAHRAAKQAEAAVEGMFGGEDRYNERHIPSVVYSHPQIARVGLTEDHARKEGMEVEIFRSSYGSNIMARTGLAGQGFAKTIFYQNTIMGAVIAGDSAAELILPLALAVSAQLTRRQMRSWVIPHPTLGEILTTHIED